MKLSLLFGKVNGARYDSRAPMFRSVNNAVAKLGAPFPVTVQFADDLSGELSAAGGPIVIGFKPEYHFSDALFDIYADNFAPVGNSGDDLLTYQTTLLLTGSALTALFAPDANGVSKEVVTIMGEVKVGDVPTTTFLLDVYNNVIKGDELPPSLDVGIPVYPTSTEVKGAIKAVGYAFSNYAPQASDEVDAALVGKTPGAGSVNGSGELVNAGTLNLYSAGNFTTGTGFVRNANLWCPGDFTCFSPWNSRENGYQGGTLITSRHAVFAEHFSGVGGSNPLQAGDVVKFVGASGTIYPRRLVATPVSVANTDLCVGTLQALEGSGDPDDLPADVTPARVLPANMGTGYFPAGTAILWTNKNKELHVAEVLDFDAATIRGALAANRLPWRGDNGGYPVLGDSGSPTFFLFDGQPALWFLFRSANDGNALCDHLAALNALLGNGYAVGVAPLVLPPARRPGVDSGSGQDGNPAILSANNTFTGSNTFSGGSFDNTQAGSAAYRGGSVLGDLGVTGAAHDDNDAWHWKPDGSGDAANGAFTVDTAGNVTAHGLRVFANAQIDGTTNLGGNLTVSFSSAFTHVVPLAGGVILGAPSGATKIYGGVVSLDTASGHLELATTGDLVCTVPVKPGMYAVAELPSAADHAGATAMVNDSDSDFGGAIGNVVAGGGAHIVPVFSDGANWIIG